MRHIHKLIYGGVILILAVAAFPSVHGHEHDEGWTVAMASQQSARERKKAMRALETSAAFADGALSRGNPNGSLTLVEFGDYNCGYCRLMHQTIGDIVELDGDIHLIYREYPALGRGSVEAARLVLAVMETDMDAAQKLQDTLYTMRGRLGEQQVIDAIKAQGLDAVAIIRAAKEQRISDILSQTFAMSQQLGFAATPTLIANGEISEGFLSEDDLLEFIAIARANR